MVELKTPRGMRDFLPEQAKKKQFLQDLIRQEFERFGFEPLETPVVEEYSTLSGKAGEAIKQEIYYFKDQSDRELGLRFDLTVPLARVVASNPSMPKPFKRYQIGTVYRYDKPQAQRYREFTQADIDIIGPNSVYVDFEILQCALNIMKKLGTEFYIRLNNRVLLEEIAKASGIPQEKVVDAFRSIDKLDKIGWEGVEKEFEQKKIPGKMLDLVKENDLKKVEKLLKSSENLKALQELLELFGKDSKFVKIDLSLARGLEYYTGNVFEVIVSSGKWTVAAGGRYDNLVSVFGGPKTPGIGISFGVDRLLDVLDSEGKLSVQSKTKFFFLPVGEKVLQKSLQLAQEIRELGINCEIDLMQRGISKNLDYAFKKGIPFVLIFGDNEEKEKILTLRDMKTGKQDKIKLSEIEKLGKL
ncbi:MAG: histidine--tRNA ligase [Candidatus Diapherotrites archaeon]|nr:histidine--tRNA ligase [Candidatus Diapherotrites archaeon]